MLHHERLQSSSARTPFAAFRVSTFGDERAATKRVLQRWNPSYVFKPIIFVINNNGYSIERAMHGPWQGYNDISMLWDHQQMLRFFEAREQTGIKGHSRATRTVEELEAVLKDEEFGKGDSIHLCEIFMDQFDDPGDCLSSLRLKGQK